MSCLLLSARAVGPPSFPLDRVIIEGHGWDSSLCSLQRHSSSPRGIYSIGQLSRGAWFAEVGRGRAWDEVGWSVTPFFAFSFQIIFQSTLVSASITSALVQVLTTSYVVSSLVSSLLVSTVLFSWVFYSTDLPCALSPTTLHRRIQSKMLSFLLS